MTSALMRRMVDRRKYYTFPRSFSLLTTIFLFGGFSVIKPCNLESSRVDDCLKNQLHIIDRKNNRRGLLALMDMIEFQIANSLVLSIEIEKFKTSDRDLHIHPWF